MLPIWRSLVGILFLVQVCLLGILHVAQASEIYEYNRPLRSLGMGGAYIAYAKPTDAPMVNPAILGFSSEIGWEMVNVSAGINGLDIYNTAKNFKQISSPTDYNQYFGKRFWVDAAGKTSLVLPNFGITAYDEFKTDFYLQNPAYPKFNMNFINDYGAVMAGAFNIGPLSSFGLAVKRINRWGGSQQIGLGIIAAGSGSQIIDQFQNKGVGYGADAAWMTKFPGTFEPRFAIVWQDLGDTSFTKTSGAQAPDKIKNNLSLAGGAVLDLPGLDLSTSFEVRHILNSEYSFGQKIHMGGELSLPFIDLRAGISEGYPAYGIGLNVFFIDFDAAYYFTEVGAYPGQTPQNRIQLGLSLGLSVNADFKIDLKDGRRRKLKQRR